MSKMSEIHADGMAYLDLLSANARAEQLIYSAFGGVTPFVMGAPLNSAPKFNPRTRLKGLGLNLFAVSNAFWQRPDSLRRVKGEI